MKNIKIATGDIDFKAIIENSECFVDKTLLIRDVLELGSRKVVLFTRPRRFGKSLNCNMVKTFLELEVDKAGEELPEEKKVNPALFKNLKIANDPESTSTIMAEMGKYPVISISFGGIKEETWVKCYSKLQNRLADLYKSFKFLLKTDELTDTEKETFEAILSQKASQTDTELSLKKLSKYLADHYNKKVVILIDEYDSVMTFAYSCKKPYFSDDAHPFMQSFMTEALKDNLNLRLGYVTGILRTAQANIFSLLNNLFVYTVADKKFCQYFGFTKDEVEELAARYGALDKMDEIKEWYNGYKYGNIEIYNPWSILRYFENNYEPEHYWVNTSDNLLIYELIRDAKLRSNTNIINFMAGKSIQSGIDESIVYSKLKNNNKSIWTFLLSAGYLTPVEDYDKSNINKLYTLIPPNKEVKNAIENLFANNIDESYGSNNLIECINCLANGEVNDFQKKINEIISSVISVRNYYEFFYHGLIIGIVLYLNERYNIESEKESGDGYPDLICTPKSINDHNGLVIEIKRVKDPYEAKDILSDSDELKKQIYSKFKEAFVQISNKKYQNHLLKENTVKDILKYALVFCKKECFVLLQINDDQVLKNGDGSNISLVELDKF